MGGPAPLAERVLLLNVVREAVAEERLDEETLRAQYDGCFRHVFTTLEVAHILVDVEAEAERIAERTETFEQVARRNLPPGFGPERGSLGAYSEAEFLSSSTPTGSPWALELEPGDLGPGGDVVRLALIRMVSREVLRSIVEERPARGGAGQVPGVDARAAGFDGHRREPAVRQVRSRTGEVVAVRSTAAEGEEG